MKGNKGERRKNEWEISERATEYERLLTLGKELWEGVVVSEVAGGRGDWVTGTEASLDLMSTECYTICWQSALK